MSINHFRLSKTLKCYTNRVVKDIYFKTWFFYKAEWEGQCGSQQGLKGPALPICSALQIAMVTLTERKKIKLVVIWFDSFLRVILWTSNLQTQKRTKKFLTAIILICHLKIL